MARDHQIAALWIGGSLSYMEQLCLKSFVDAGQHVKLFTYGAVQNVPEGVELADGNAILPMDGVITHGRSGSPAPQADKFRYHMLAKCDRTIWADTDAYCVRPFTTSTGHFHGWESESHINNGVLGLPQDSDTLAELVAFTADEYAIPDWLPDAQKREMEAAAARGAPIHVGEQSWGVWGPQALTHFLHKTGEAKYALPIEALYPVSFKHRRMMLQPGLDLSRYITANTLSIHFYGRRMRKRLVEKEGGVPHPHSLIGQLIAKHAIDPAAAPLPPAAPAPAPAPAAAAPAPDAAPAPERLAPADRAGRGVLNLTDLADRHGSDRGHLKHRYSELYNLLFQPLRGRAIGFVEVGPQVLDRAAPGQEPDLPSIRMWLEWFTRARIFGLSTQATPDIDEPRFAALRAEDGGGQALAAALPADLRPDIVLYAAPAASHLQQEAFLGLFPRLAAGGIFVIEGLRWQPADLEREGTKTAALFQSYLETGVFRHSDDATAAAMNALRPDISGCFVFQAKYVKTNRDQLLVVHKR